MSVQLAEEKNMLANADAWSLRQHACIFHARQHGYSNDLARVQVVLVTVTQLRSASHNNSIHWKY
jgi:hypothetical protein